MKTIWKSKSAAMLAFFLTALFNHCKLAEASTISFEVNQTFNSGSGALNIASYLPAVSGETYNFIGGNVDFSVISPEAGAGSAIGASAFGYAPSQNYGQFLFETISYGCGFLGLGLCYNDTWNAVYVYTNENVLYNYYASDQGANITVGTTTSSGSSPTSSIEYYEGVSTSDSYVSTTSYNNGDGTTTDVNYNEFRTSNYTIDENSGGTYGIDIPLDVDALQSLNSTLTIPFDFTILGAAYGTTQLNGGFVTLDYNLVDPVSVPEPGTIALAGLGLGVLEFSRRKRKPLH